MTEQKWLISVHDSDFSDSLDSFTSREEALEYAKNMDVVEIKQLAEEQGVNIEDLEKLVMHIAKRVEFVVHVGVDEVLDSIRADAYDFSIDYAQGFLVTVKPEHELLLETYLSNAVKAWMKETNNEPHFFNVESTCVVERDIV